MVQRYENDYGDILEAEDGTFVLYEDYAALEKELAALKSKMTMTELVELSQELKLYD